jgi:hypothetical protein
LPIEGSRRNLFVLLAGRQQSGGWSSTTNLREVQRTTNKHQKTSKNDVRRCFSIVFIMEIIRKKNEEKK